LEEFRETEGNLKGSFTNAGSRDTNRIQRGELMGHVSVIVLNELVHKLIVGEVAQKAELKPGQVVQYLK